MIDSELQSKLDGHTQDVHARAASKSSWKKHLKSWPVYTAAGSSTLAMVASAGAGIIYSGIQNLTVNAPGGIGANNMHINIGTGAGILAYAFHSTSFSSNTVGLRGAGPNSVMIFSGLRNVASGMAISGAGTFSTSGSAFGMSNFGGPNTFGNFAPSNTGFAGVRLNDPMGTYFGWVRLHVNTRLQ